MYISISKIGSENVNVRCEMYCIIQLDLIAEIGR